MRLTWEDGGSAPFIGAHATLVATARLRRLAAAIRCALMAPPEAARRRHTYEVICQDGAAER
jgi:hypothetical protein